jgi:hypothetical protein
MRINKSDPEIRFVDPRALDIYSPIRQTSTHDFTHILHTFYTHFTHQSFTKGIPYVTYIYY